MSENEMSENEMIAETLDDALQAARKLEQHTAGAAEMIGASVYSQRLVADVRALALATELLRKRVEHITERTHRALDRWQEHDAYAPSGAVDDDD